MAKRGRNKWGGARRGAGRPRTRRIPSEPHKQRPAIAPHHPVLVTARLAIRAARSAFDRALDLSLERADFRIIHLGLRAAWLELIVEAADRNALARGMQGFQVSAARSVNRQLRRTGGVFVDRYRARSLATRPALAAAVARLPRGARTRVGVPESALLISSSAGRRRGSAAR